MCQLVTLCHPALAYIFNLWHSGTLSLQPEYQSARMSQIKNVGWTWMARNTLKCNHLMLLHLIELMKFAISIVIWVWRNEECFKVIGSEVKVFGTTLVRTLWIWYLCSFHVILMRLVTNNHHARTLQSQKLEFKVVRTLNSFFVSFWTYYHLC